MHFLDGEVESMPGI